MHGKTLIALACTALLSACGGGDGGSTGNPATPSNGTPNPPAATETPLALDCARIAQLALPGTTLSTASVPAGTVLSGNTLPEHCVVTGQMNPRTGADGKPYHIGFELRLPKSWNGRFMFQGGGGNDGTVRPALGALAGNAGSLPGLQTGALAQGFAVVSTDAGHQGTDASFGLDPQARIDHAYNSYDQVTLAAKDLIARAYGRAPDHSYFVGCSGGGRQALLFPQRFPNHFDGVAANAPAIKVAKEATLASVWSSIGYRAIAPGGVLAQALSDSDLKLVANAVLQRCDGLDGAVDGIVAANPGACNFDPAVLQCSGAKTDSCLTAGQVGALKRDFGGPRNSAGHPLYASWPWDPGIAGADWRNWRLGTSATAEPNSRNVTLIAADAMRKEFFTPAAPDFDFWSFNFDTDPARLDAYAAIYNTASTDVGAFKQRGGKMLIVHGTADPIFSASDSIDYVERLAAAHGGAAQAQQFARLFLVPGMNHCSNSGGPATDLYDALTPLVEWVEKGQAPERIVAKAAATAPWPGRTRPLCPYPKIAQYNGSGSVEDAASFSCE
ncbi:tannase/feruloyl esterase family alpha/beta hydrolase [Azohydromonas caseinilytica]|uniref:Tannase/feruloyl esterase family alpha/beta hydrolase n=1 Tax=Azohydromonas caseinilytica TaxID=2728836 RepID=A0A848FE11_9BURK|nr:tannase/feruloyl esterase family alpha/beta hydrolase [Azohydromonas caseinilytica]NML16390.1 tannase/feruloyl esterase family alpha/beta hydrolase [Azohydromonas caseinilytica]